MFLGVGGRETESRNLYSSVKCAGHASLGTPGLLVGMVVGMVGASKLKVVIRHTVTKPADCRLLPLS